MEQFAEYGHAMVSLAGVSILGLLLSPLVAIRKMGKGLAAGSTPEGGYGDSAYRLHRAYGNLTENLGFFVAVVVAAILAGVSPFWVNLLASVFLISRIVLLAVHLMGVPPMNVGPRTMVYVVGWGCSLILGVMTIVAVF